MVFFGGGRMGRMAQGADQGYHGGSFLIGIEITPGHRVGAIPTGAAELRAARMGAVAPGEGGLGDRAHDCAGGLGI